MKHSVLLDYELTAAQDGFVVRALHRLEGQAPAVEQAADLSSLTDRLEQRSFDAADAKYLAQRAYNTHRAKGAYEEKLRRRR